MYSSEKQNPPAKRRLSSGNPADEPQEGINGKSTGYLSARNLSKFHDPGFGSSATKVRNIKRLRFTVVARLKKGTGHLLLSNCLNLLRHGNDSSTGAPWGVSGDEGCRPHSPLGAPAGIASIVRHERIRLHGNPTLRSVGPEVKSAGR
ncbi:MAG: hypothetical protein NTW68_01695 [candidate division NC10 bacterium]|nr:hypothetical protein [candidate division NC10 bacterium]